MNLRKLVTIAVLVVVGGALAHAQPVSIEISFPFVVGGKDFAAGKYSFDVRNEATGPMIILRGATETQSLLTITRLARHDQDPDFEAAFDKIGGKYFLSEVWFPGKDGYLVLSTKEAHEHAVQGGSNPKK